MRDVVARLAALFLLAAPAHAQVDGPSRVSFTWENDVFARTDRHYTNGMRIQLSGRIDSSALPAWLAGDETEWGLAVGQRIYTPEHLETDRVVTDDRPYAGWAYVGVSVRRRVTAMAWEDRIELTLGVIGPASGAQDTHELAHRLNGSEAPRGWAHQLRNEPTITLSYRGSAQLTRGDLAGLSYDVRPHFGVTLGNVSTSIAVGIGMRCGLGVPNEYVQPLPLRFYVVAAAEARLVGHDAFVDGSLVRLGGHFVPREPLVVDTSLGLVLAVHDRVTLTYVHTLRTREFVGQVRPDHFGSISFAIAW